MAVVDATPDRIPTPTHLPPADSLDRGLAAFPKSVIAALVLVLTSFHNDPPTRSRLRSLSTCLSRNSADIQGTLTPLLGIGACVSIQFGALEWAKRLFSSRNGGRELNFGA
jgi:hypothetical protein